MKNMMPNHFLLQLHGWNESNAASLVLLIQHDFGATACCKQANSKPNAEGKIPLSHNQISCHTDARALNLSQLFMVV